MQTPRLAFIPLLTENEKARGVLAFLDRDRPDIELSESREVLAFFSSLHRPVIAGGIRLYCRKEGISRVRSPKSTHLFKVLSEDSPKPYFAGFRMKEDDVPGLEVACTCAWKTAGRESEARVCKHIIASMLYLVHNAGRELPHFRRLLNFLVFCIIYANPSEQLLRTMDKPQREKYVRAWTGVRDSLKGLLDSVGTARPKD